MLRAIALLSFSAALFAQTDPAPPKFRLGGEVRPSRYRLELTLVPAEDTFSGKVEIDLEVRKATPAIWLHGVDLQVREASLSRGGRREAARVVPAQNEFLGFAFEHPLEPGPATLQIDYQGKLSKKGMSGLFAQKEGEDWYAFTQFEATDARRAIPCFDEPGFKVPWQITLRVSKDHLALANTPAVAESDGPDGLKSVRFAETKPLPSYLVALAAGPFEVVDAGKAGKKKTPLRIIVPRGKKDQARYAVEATPAILNLLEAYFGTPYPFEKLDSIAVPLFGGAMENPGLITYHENILLARPEDETINFKRSYAGAAAHEIAHIWFGDLVTTAWWDDVWLNEGFASWMGNKIVQRWKPEWESNVSGVSSSQGAMNNDSLVTARRVRQPIESKHDIANAFDGITYSKGAAVLAMFERWMGEEKFRNGVRLYLKKHAWGNAASADFLKALSEGSERNVTAAFSTFLEQPGVPMVSLELKCGGGVKLALAQKRYLPLGSKGSADQLWQIPVCVEFGAGGKASHQCTLMAQKQTEVPLTGAKVCPDYVVGNDEQAGYYRVGYRGGLLQRLLQDGGKRLKVVERVGVLGDAFALMRSGDLPAGDALALAAPFAQDPNRHVVNRTLSIAGSIRANLVPDELRPNWTRFIAKTYGARARELGWQPKPGEDEETRLLRTSIVSLVANETDDPALVAEARALALKWLENRRAVDADLIGAALGVAARHGDRELFETFHAAASKTQDRRDRSRLLNAMGSFRDPACARQAMQIALGDEFDLRESMGLVFGAMGDPATRAIPFEFVKQNYDAIVAKLPGNFVGEFAAFLPQVGGAFCDEQRRAEVEAFFKERSAKATGGPRVLAQVLEGISLCSAARQANRASVAAFLKQY